MAPRLASALAALLGALAVAACGGGSSTSSASTTSATAHTSAAAGSAAAAPLSYEGIPLQPGPSLAPASTTQTVNVDRIRCGPSEQLAYHIHAHLAVFVNGRPYSLPAGIGIPGSVVQQSAQGPVAAGGQCIYWLHTHTSDGVIHVESPTQRIYTLGDFFDEWHQPLTAAQVAGVHGPIAAFVNGRPWSKSPRAIPLVPHALIQLQIGQPAPPLTNVNWAGTGL